MTVSRVINGGHLVSPHTAARIRSAIKKLGYHPNEAARMLKGRISKTIGLILPDLSDTFFSVCAHSVQQFAAKRGYTTVLLASERDAMMEAAELEMLKARSIAGTARRAPLPRTATDEVMAAIGARSGQPVAADEPPA